MTIFDKIIPFILILISSCSSINTINYKRINTVELDEIKTLHIYQNKPLNGVFKVKFSHDNEYIIENYKDGLLHGKRQIFRNRKLYQEENYQNGVLTGSFVMYYNHIKQTQYNCENGLPNGEKLIFGENGRDTLCSLIYVTTPLKMDIYVDKSSDITIDKSDHILFATQPCMLKADKFVQSYYSKKDSTLLETIVWNKDGYCYYKREE